MKVHKERLAQIPRENGNSNHENELLLELLIKNKPESKELLFRLIDILLDKIKVLEQTTNELKNSVEELKTEQNKPILPELLNCKQSCKLLQMSSQTLNERRKEGKIKAFRIGKNYMYELADLLKLGRPVMRH